MDWERIFAKHRSDKLLTSKMQIRKKEKQSNRRWAKDLNRYFTKEDIRMTNQSIRHQENAN